MENNKNQGVQGTDNNAQENNGAKQGSDLENLKKELEQEKKLREELEANNAKFKTRIDELTHEISESKKATKAKMTEEEKRQAELEEKENQIKELSTKVQIQEKTSKYLAIGFDVEVANEVAAAEVKGDMESVYKRITELVAKAKADGEEAYLKSRPKTQAGGEGGKNEDAFLAGFNSKKY